MLGAKGRYLPVDQAVRTAIDVRKLVKPAAEAGIAFNPGPEWAVSAAQFQQLPASLLRNAK